MFRYYECVYDATDKECPWSSKGPFDCGDWAFNPEQVSSRPPPLNKIPVYAPASHCYIYSTVPGSPLPLGVCIKVITYVSHLYQAQYWIRIPVKFSVESKSRLQ